MSQAPKRLLIVDDNDDVRLALQLALETAGYEVEAAAHGADALRLQEKHPAQVLITDIFMPEADGFETIQAFRAAYPRTRIIVMSGGGERVKRDHLAAAMLIGVDATLQKPVDIDVLLRKLAELAQ